MAKPSKKKSKTHAKRQRRERRFEPRATANKWLVYACGVVGATAMGAGTWGQFGPAISGGEGEPFKYAPWILAGGAILVGIAIWFGTSGEPALRVGDPGVGVERGELRRIPWHQVERIALDGAALKITGKDELGNDLVIRAKLASHPQAAAWIVREARARVPSAVDVPDDATEIPRALDGAGEALTVEPMQVVGKHCAASGKVIAYEPDARVCTRCERVYHKAHMPTTCVCGSSMAGHKSGAKKSDEGEDDAVKEALAASDEPVGAPAELATAAEKPEGG